MIKHAHVFSSMLRYTHVCSCMLMYTVYAHVWSCMLMYTHVYSYIHMYAHVCSCAHVCACIFIYNQVMYIFVCSCILIRCGKIICENFLYDTFYYLALPVSLFMKQAVNILTWSFYNFFH